MKSALFLLPGQREWKELLKGSQLRKKKQIMGQQWVFDGLPFAFPNQDDALTWDQNTFWTGHGIIIHILCYMPTLTQMRS